MKALELSVEKELRIVEADLPRVGPKDVLVKLKAASLNHREIWISKGLYPGMALPCILGADGAGVIEAIGDDVEQALLNQEVIIYPAYDWGSNQDIPQKQFRVLGMPDPGTLAEYISVPSEMVYEKPAYLSWQQAAAMPIAGLTSWRALYHYAKIKTGDKVLITGIGGGVAQFGLKLAKSFGAEVIVTSSSLDKIEQSKSHGAIGGVNYKDEDWQSQLQELCGGIDIVLDSSPSADLDSYLTFLNRGARIVAYGSTGSRKTTLNISKFFLRHIQFIGTAMGSPQDFSELLMHMKEKKLIPTIHSSYSFEDCLEAIKFLEEGKQLGKIVIDFQ